jgi:hypothetical protein
MTKTTEKKVKHEKKVSQKWQKKERGNEHRRKTENSKVLVEHANVQCLPLPEVGSLRKTYSLHSPLGPSPHENQYQQQQVDSQGQEEEEQEGH